MMEQIGVLENLLRGDLWMQRAICRGVLQATVSADRGAGRGQRWSFLACREPFAGCPFLRHRILPGNLGYPGDCRGARPSSLWDTLRGDGRLLASGLGQAGAVA